ncbi:hypothetical protein [Sneathiella limimaris]|uniref:hypothetical protein n=1 Tax=Sneathiella limimaris TaxID=1964213 RepID=UPI00146E01BA|nr:hypothetical protein [Sneathiella limimaris]
MFKKLATLAGASIVAVGLMGVSAQAAILDFTSEATKSAVEGGTPGEIDFFGTTATISSTAGALTWTAQDGGTCATPPLDCSLDGLGVVDDEVSPGRQSITISFAKAISLDAIYFLDLFTSFGGQSKEQAEVSWGGGNSGAGFASYFADSDEIKPDGDSGYLKVEFDGYKHVSWLTFTALDINPGDDLGVNDFSVAAISAVPLPAALPLYGAALAVLGLFGWNRKRKA